MSSSSQLPVRTVLLTKRGVSESIAVAPSPAARSSTYLPSLDGIRAVCIILVIGAHAAQTVGFPEQWKPVAAYLFNGAVGVTVFFVLSGFLITLLLIREEQATKGI